MPIPKTSCIILAGGQGTRFDGADKGLIKLDGKPLIEHVLNRIAPQVDDIVISANRNQEQYRKYTPTVVTDSIRNYSGPIAGLAASLAHCKHDWVLVVPCDMPFLPMDLLAQLHQTIGDKQICGARVDDRLQLVIYMNKNLAASIEDALEQSHLKLTQWLESLSPTIADFSNDQHEFDNLNCFADHTKLSY